MRVRITKPYFLFDEKKRTFENIVDNIFDVRWQTLKHVKIRMQDGREVLVSKDAVQRV